MVPLFWSEIIFSSSARELKRISRLISSIRLSQVPVLVGLLDPALQVEDGGLQRLVLVNKRHHPVDEPMAVL